MDEVTVSVVEGHGRTTRELNEEIRLLLRRGHRDLEVRHPGARHSLGVGILEPAKISFKGSVGYFCAALSAGLDVSIDGDAGWSLAADMMDGRVVCNGNSGSSTAASVRGGVVVVKGNAGARTAIALRGGTVIVGGDSGYMTGFMMQKGRLVVCGDVGEAFGDSMYRGQLFCGGEIADLGSDAILEQPDEEDLVWLEGVLDPFRLGPKRAWKKVRSGEKLWRYDRKEFAIWRHAL
jgi:methylamine---glutamate N-methyltransferase subunit B